MKGDHSMQFRKILIMTCFFITAHNHVYMHAMELARPEVQSDSEGECSRSNTPPPFVAPDISSLQAVLVNEATNSGSVMAASAPPFEEAPPAYSYVDPLKEASSSSAATKTMPSLFDEQDAEWRELFAQAQQSGAGNDLQELVNAAYMTDAKMVMNHMENIRTDVGLLPLRAAIKGNKLETVKELACYYTHDDARHVFFETVRHKQHSIAQFLVDRYKLDFTCADLRKALMGGSVDRSFLDLFVAHGVTVNPCVAVENSPLYVAIAASCPEATSYFLEKGANPLNGESLIFEEAKKMPAIKKMVLQATEKQKEKNKREEEEKQRERDRLAKEEIDRRAAVPALLRDLFKDEEYKNLLKQSANGKEALDFLINAAYAGNTQEAVDKLEKSNMNAGSIVLRAAIRGGHVDAFQNVWPYCTQEERDKALDDIPGYAPTPFVKYFCKEWAPTDKLSKNLLATAIDRQDVERLSGILAGKKIFPRYNNLNRAIRVCDGNNFDVLNCLIAYGARLNPDLRWDKEDYSNGLLGAREDYDRFESPLRVAVRQGKVGTVNYLIANGADAAVCYEASSDSKRLKAIEINILDIQTIPAIAKVLRDAIEQKKRERREQQQKEQQQKKKDGCILQ